MAGVLSFHAPCRYFVAWFMEGSGIHQQKLDIFFSSPIVETEGRDPRYLDFWSAFVQGKKSERSWEGSAPFFYRFQICIIYCAGVQTDSLQWKQGVFTTKFGQHVAVPKNVTLLILRHLIRFNRPVCHQNVNCRTKVHLIRLQYPWCFRNPANHLELYQILSLRSK